jgi:hypothetical protein
MWVEESKNGKFKFCERYTDYLTGKVKRVTVTIDKNTPQSRKTLILCGVFNVALNACPNKRGRKGATLKNRYLCNLLIVFLRELFGDM